MSTVHVRLPDPARSRAVLIGASRYDDPKFTPIPAVANNLADLAGVLTSPLGTGLPPEHCTVLLNQANQAEVGERIVRAADEAQDLLLVYYAGHGEMTWDKVNELCLTLTGTKHSSLRTSSLRCADLRHYLHGGRAKTRVLILDCCFAGQSLNGTLASPTGTVLSAVAMDSTGSYVLAATYGLALAPPDRTHTLFTGALLRLLREGIPTAPGMLLTLDALFQGVKSAMRRDGLPEPCSNHSDTAGWLALAHNVANETRLALAGLRSRVDALGAAQAQAQAATARAADRIAEPNLPTAELTAPALRRRLAEIERLALGGRPPPTGELEALETEITRAGGAAQRSRELATGLLGRRDRLRGRLQSYWEMANRFGLVHDEHADVVGRYGAARDLLWTKPCDLHAATHAVNAFQQAVITGREGHR